MYQNPYQPPGFAPPQAAYGMQPGYPPPQPAAEVPQHVSVFKAIGFAFSSHVGIGKLLMGLLLLFIPMVGPIVLAGWMAETHRRLAYRQGPAVRGFSFNEFVPYLMAGLVPFVAQLAVVFVAMLPMGLLGGVMAGAMASLAEAGEPLPGVILYMPILLAVVALPLMVIVTSLGTVLMLRAELTGSFQHTFAMGPAWSMFKRQWLRILGHHLLLGLVSIPLMLLGVLAFFVGIYVVAVALQFAQLHLRWQIYEVDLRMGGQPLPVIPGNGATFS